MNLKQASPTSSFLKTLSDIKILQILLVERLGGEVTVSQSDLKETEEGLRSGRIQVEAFRNKENNDVVISIKQNMKENKT